MATTDNSSLLLNTDPNSFLQYTNSLTGNQSSTPNFQVGVNANDSTVGNLYGTIGNSQSSSVAPGTPQSGSTTGASNGSNLFGNLSNVYNGVKSLGSGVTNAVNEFGSNYLGFGSQSGAPFASGIQGATESGAPLSDVLQGPGNAFDTTGALGTTSSFSSALGGAGFGYAAGGLLAGLLGENKTGGAIGGAIGGLAGATFLGGLSGIGVGAELGSIVPGIGTVIGAAAGALLGGLFGGGTPHPASGVNYNGGLGSDGTLVNPATGSKDESGSIGQGLGGDFQSYLQQQASTYGIKYSGITGALVDSDKGYFGSPGTIVLSTDPDYAKKVGVGIGNAPTTSNAQYQVINFDPNDPNSKAAAYQQAFNYAATTSGLDPTKLTPQTGSGSVQIPANQNPSQWQQWLANYRAQHTTPTTQAS